MQRRSLLKNMLMVTGGAAYSLSFPSLRAAIASESNVEWGYEEDNGPEFWANSPPISASARRVNNNPPSIYRVRCQLSCLS